MYQLARPLLFRLDAERAHRLVLRGLANGAALARGIYGRSVPQAPCEVMGLRFGNRIGLAAGLDKDGECIDGLAALGFGFIEVGTVTPRPQPGNPRPRLFRLPRDRALINRMGFNNRGVDHLLDCIAASGYGGVLGINIGKNFDTPNEHAAEDYLTCLRAVYPHAGYVAVNISSPNTRGLRELQERDPINALLAALGRERRRLSEVHGRRVPLAVKVAPDLDADGLKAIADSVQRHGMDAVIATNTSVSRPRLKHTRLARESGGLSGAPLAALANRTIHRLARYLDGALPIIGVGGVMSGADARAKLEAGASLVQIYTGLIYSGPALVRECVEATASSNAANT